MPPPATGVAEVRAVLDIVTITPFERPDPGLVRALLRAGATAFLDLGRDPAAARRALAALDGESFGVRIPEGTVPPPLPRGVHTILGGPELDPAAWPDRQVWIEVRTDAEARDAIARGAAAVVARGSESGGRVGPESAFVLTQRLARLPVPVYIQGGIGQHTIAACAIARVAGVVLDAQLALLPEASLPEAIRHAVRTMDGSETTVVGDHRVFTRPDLPVAKTPPTDPAVVRALLGGDDLQRQLLPAGQDAAFAAPLAAAFPSARALVAGLRAAALAHLQAAATADPLSEGSPLAVAQGTTWPIAQGPMTRVSDRPDFARAVAEGGGLPFVALSLLDGPASLRLLQETDRVCAGRPWGVGILGFVPPELRATQLAALAQVRPPFALIAGGRPSQARALEAAGTPTWLHAPSPALLDSFLADGARRFVFEGSECGGHVGPRTSFVLWEQQIGRLLASDHVAETSALFAGGVHDGLSGAMVAAMAGTLAQAGARVGVLAGTAYLFTEEAVSTGAILPGFQQAAIETATTVLLETAPGHATRCAPTPFTGAFEAERRRLQAEGAEAKAVWASLEQLNVGRLRVAAKGLQRVGEALVEVDAAQQAADGLYMIGQVAGLRHSLTTIAELHRDIGQGSTERLAAWEGRVVGPGAPPPADIAIIGMACVLPDAPDLGTYWHHLQRGHDAVREVPAERWRADLYHDVDGEPGETTPSRWGAFVPELRFDPLRYGIQPRSLTSIDPVQLIALDVARRALDDAGYGHRPFDRERASVIFGAESGSDLGAAYSFRAHHRQWAGPLSPALDAALPRLSHDSFPGVLANVVAGRIANRLDLGGVNYTVDAACASSLAAIDLGVKELSAGTSDVVLCGGADLHNGINDYLLFASAHALSPTGHCRSFDADADGIVLGEGVVCVVLKRLDDARRDGDRVYAVIRGVGGSSDGRSLGLTAPRKEGQKRAVARAWAQARLDPRAVGLIEAHGTGTVVGDRTELQTLTETFAGAQAPITLGSVKSQIGHTKCAAGLAGLVKATLAVHHGVRPPTFGIQRPNPAWSAASSPFTFSTAARPWPAARRSAGISAFGFGGTNFHVVLESDDASPQAPAVRPAELLLLRGDEAEVDHTFDLLARQLASPEPPPLAALARALRADGPVRVAIVASSADHLRALLPAARARQPIPGALWIAAPHDGAVAFLFPGQGSQRPHMLRELFTEEPRLQRFLSLAPDLLERLYPPDAWDEPTRRAQQAALTDTRAAQPALGLTSLAASSFLEACGVTASMAGGHSYGELSALAWAGAMDPADLLRLSRARAEALLAAAPDDPGAMAAVQASAAEVAGWLDELPDVVIANRNAPRQTVIAGPTGSIAAALARLQAVGAQARPLPVAAAFHSPVVAAAAEAFREVLRATPLRPPDVPVWSNTTALPHPSDPDGIADHLARQVAEPVRFVEQIEAMYAAGARTFVEVGAGRVLCGLVEKILGDRPFQAIPVDIPGEPGWATLLGALAALACAGLPVREAALFEGRELPTVDLAVIPPASMSMWRVDGHRARPEHGDAPPGGLIPILEPLGGPPTPVVPTGDAREQVVLSFLDNLQTLALAQRDAVLALLGQAPATPAPSDRATARALPQITAAPAVAPPPQAPPRPTDLLALVSQVVAERTGYPAEMLGPDLDLEADLSIDSIKRIEILTSLAEALDGSGGPLEDEDIEHLATRRTLRELVQALENRGGLGGIGRWRLVPTPAPLDDELAADSPTRLTLIGDHADTLAQALRARGVAVDVLGPELLGVPADAPVVLLGGDPPSRAPLLSRLLEAGARTVLGVDGEAPGLDGLFLAVAREHPDRRLRLLQLDPGSSPQATAAALIAESAADGPAVVRWRGADRQTWSLQAAPLTGPARPLPLSSADLVLVTGGARGITARITLALARRVPATFVLVGRSPEPGPEPADLATAADATALRRALLAAGEQRPAVIEPRVREILAAREIRDTLAALRATGAAVDYRALDVRDAAAFGALVDELYASHGRIAGVIHGAGVIEDRLLKDKTPESFRRVWETKVSPAEVLAARLRPDVGFVALFGSVSGALGNRGQSDYAAANAALARIGANLAARVTGRVFTVDWGPWGGAGMVGEALAQAYVKRGIGLIDPVDGAAAFLDELTRGAHDDTRVLWQAAGAPLGPDADG